MRRLLITALVGALAFGAGVGALWIEKPKAFGVAVVYTERPERDTNAKRLKFAGFEVTNRSHRRLEIRGLEGIARDGRTWADHGSFGRGTPVDPGESVFEIAPGGVLSADQPWRFFFRARDPSSLVNRIVDRARLLSPKWMVPVVRLSAVFDTQCWVDVPSW